MAKIYSRKSYKPAPTRRHHTSRTHLTKHKHKTHKSFKRHDQKRISFHKGSNKRHITLKKPHQKKRRPQKSYEKPSEEVLARKKRFQTGGKTLSVGDKQKKSKEALDEELQKYFLKNGQTQKVKSVLDKDLEEFMQKTAVNN